MDDPLLARQTQQLGLVWEALVRLAPRLKAVLPEELTRFKGRMLRLHSERGHRRAIDHHLFYRISAILASREHPMAMGELSEALAVPPNSATRMVEWLVEIGHVERLPDPDDRRVVRVALTPAGRDLHAAITRFMASRTEQLLCRLTPEEREQFVALMGKIVRLLEEDQE